MENLISLHPSLVFLGSILALIGGFALLFISAMSYRNISSSTPNPFNKLRNIISHIMRNGLKDDDPKQQLYHYGPFKWWAFVLLAIELPLIVLLAIERYPWESSFPFGWYDAYKTSGLPFDILAAFAAGLGIIIAVHRSELSHISHERDRKSDAIKNYYDLQKNGLEVFELYSKAIDSKTLTPHLLPSFINEIFESPYTGNFKVKKDHKKETKEDKKTLKRTKKELNKIKSIKKISDKIISQTKLSEDETNLINNNNHRYDKKNLEELIENISEQILFNLITFTPKELDITEVQGKKIEKYITDIIVTELESISILIETIESLPISKKEIKDATTPLVNLTNEVLSLKKEHEHASSHDIPLWIRSHIIDTLNDREGWKSTCTLATVTNIVEELKDLRSNPTITEYEKKMTAQLTDTEFDQFFKKFYPTVQ